jgi:hypothetical protein
LEDKYMQRTFKTLVLASAAFCATAAFAANQARVDVPFSFTAKGQSYPAGSYAVTLDADHNFVTMTNKADATKHITWSVDPADPIAAPALVTFDQFGEDHTLKTIQLGEHVTPNLDPPARRRGISATTSIGGQ